MKFSHLKPERDRHSRRQMRMVAEQLQQGALAILPTDTNYALACPLGDRAAIARLRHLRQGGDKHFFTLLCCGFEELGRYAVIDNRYFRLLKSLVPGAFGFVLRATREVPTIFAHPKRRTVGLRVPDCKILRDVISEHGQPLISCTLYQPGDGAVVSDLAGLDKWLAKVVDLVVDSATLPGGRTTVVDLTGSDPIILREGNGHSRSLEG